MAKLLIPPACREEVLGDLYERYKSPAQYLGDLISTMPFIILSQIRRTTDLRFLVMEAVLVYGCFLASAWYEARGLVTEPGGLLRLAIPSGITLLYHLFADAFNPPSRRALSDRVRSLAIYLGLIFLCMPLGLLTDANVYGFLASMMLVSAAKPFFEPDMGHSQTPAGTPVLAGRVSRSVSSTVRVTMTLILLGVTCLFLWWILSTKGAH